MHFFNILLLYTILIVLPNKYLFKEIFSEIYRLSLKNGIAWTFYSCRMTMLKLIHLLEVMGELFDLLKPKCYLGRLEDIARHAL